MKRFTYSIAILIISILSVSAQNNADAEKLINNLLAKAKANAIQSNFSLKVSEKNNVNSYLSSGTFTLNGDKFMLDMNDTKAWFDGKTQWTYMAESNEVSITEPTEKELSETNPMAILSKFKLISNVRFSKTKNEKYHVIELTPKTDKVDFKIVEVQINKSTGNLFSIKITDKKESTTLLILTQYKVVKEVNKNVFVFNKAKYEGVVINDLR